MEPFYEPRLRHSRGLLDPRYGHLGSEMLQRAVMEPSSIQSWIRDEESGEREEVVLTTAELAECTCPDPCERDHDFD